MCYWSALLVRPMSGLRINSGAACFTAADKVPSYLLLLPLWVATIIILIILPLLRVICVFPFQWLSGILLLKGGHEILTCAATLLHTKARQALTSLQKTQKNWKTDGPSPCLDRESNPRKLLSLNRRRSALTTELRPCLWFSTSGKESFKVKSSSALHPEETGCEIICGAPTTLAVKGKVKEVCEALNRQSSSATILPLCLLIFKALYWRKKCFPSKPQKQ